MRSVADPKKYFVKE